MTTVEAGVTWTRQVGDTGPDLATTLHELPVGGARVGEQVDLTGQTVTVRIVRQYDLALIVDELAAVTGGVVSTPCPELVTSWPGLYLVTWTVNGDPVRTYPVAPESHSLRVTGEPPTDPATGDPLPLRSGTPIKYWNGAGWATDTNAVIYVRRPGDPMPATNPNDIVVEKT